MEQGPGSVGTFSVSIVRVLVSLFSSGRITSTTCRNSAQDGLWNGLLASLSLSAELQVCGGLEEARVAVLLHQGVDLGLGQKETGLAGLFHVLLGGGFGLVVKIDLGDEDGWNDYYEVFTTIEYT